MPNPFVHIELTSNDVSRAKAFYKDVFDWKLEDMPMPGGPTYTMISVGEGTGGGMMQNPMPGTPSAWIPYVAVDDARASTDKAKSAGATIIRDVSEVPNMGWFSIVKDPTGAVLGLWQTKRK